MKKIYSLILVFIILSSCLSKKKINVSDESFTVQFEYIKHKSPFEPCSNLKTINSPKKFTDSLKTFTVMVDSNWSYEYSQNEADFIHLFCPKNDTNLTLVIVVEKDLYTQDTEIQQWRFSRRD